MFSVLTPSALARTTVPSLSFSRPSVSGTPVSAATKHHLPSQTLSPLFQHQSTPSKTLCGHQTNSVVTISLFAKVFQFLYQDFLSMAKRKRRFLCILLHNLWWKRKCASNLAHDIYTILTPKLHHHPKRSQRTTQMTLAMRSTCTTSSRQAFCLVLTTRMTRPVLLAPKEQKKKTNGDNLTAQSPDGTPNTTAQTKY